MPRLPKGQKPEPIKSRLQRYRRELEESGGARLFVDIGPEANEAMKAVIAREGITKKEAVERGLLSLERKGP